MGKKVRKRHLKLGIRTVCRDYISSRWSTIDSEKGYHDMHKNHHPFALPTLANKFLTCSSATVARDNSSLLSFSKTFKCFS